MPWKYWDYLLILLTYFQCCYYCFLFYCSTFPRPLYIRPGISTAS